MSSVIDFFRHYYTLSFIKNTVSGVYNSNLLK